MIYKENNKLELNGTLEDILIEYMELGAAIATEMRVQLIPENIIKELFDGLIEVALVENEEAMDRFELYHKHKKGLFS